MLTPEEVTRLEAMIRESADKHDPLLGAHLGGLVKTHFPDIKIKSEYGSFRKFVDAHLSDLLELDGTRGRDDKYALKQAQSPGVTPGARGNVGNVHDVPLAISLVDDAEASQNEAALRTTMKAALDLMTAEQIRQLVLPVGIIFDAISKTKGI